MPEVDAKIIAPFHLNAYLDQLPAGIVSGRRINRLPLLGNYLRAGNQFLGAIQARSFSPDIIHETYFSRYINWSRKALHVVTVYDMIHELFPDNFPGKLQVIEQKKAAVEKADRVICISENTKNDLLKLYDIPEEKVSVVHLGFEMQISDVKMPQKKAGYDDMKYLLYVGERHGYKNFTKFLQAYAASSFLRENFMVVCFGGGPFKACENERFLELKLSSKQIKQIAGGDQLLAKYYQDAELFVFPSLYEGFGIPLLEAMSNNCPVACSHAGSIPEIAGTAAAFFDPEDADSIRDVIEKIIQSNDLLTDLRQKGAKRIHSFSWEKCARVTLNVYEQSLRAY
ncbi:MAG: glycosyltransferase family 1 protein [Gammaproteobacteria bacterium]|nr:MAG: glycosyltransferase family 1 protein [Gammaproteobacteria bacterium]